MSLAASGQLIDRYPSVFLPGASGRDRRCVGGISRQGVAKLAAAAHQDVEVGQVSFDLRSQALIHWSRLALLADITREARGLDEPRHCEVSGALDSPGRAW